MRTLAPLLTLGLLAAWSHFRSATLADRLRTMDDRVAAERAANDGLAQRLSQLEASLGQSHDLIGRLSEGQYRVGELEHELASANCRLEDSLAEAQRSLTSQEQRLRDFENLAQDLAPEALQSRFDRWRAALRNDWSSLEDTLFSTHTMAVEQARLLDELDRRVERDPEGMWSAMMAPVVQLSGETTVGSGVLLSSMPGEHGHTTHVLTAWHVVRDILADDDLVDGPIPVSVYDREGRAHHHGGRLLQFDARLDVALLVLDTQHELPTVKLPRREQLAAARVFDAIYAVGCPLGNDPIPTFGEVADLEHIVGDERYWMISAPTFIGNSGGGIFAADSHELLGIFSKIYTHGTLRPTVVPHMGLVMPMASIYDWLDRVGFAELIDSHSDGGTSVRWAAAERE